MNLAVGLLGGMLIVWGVLTGVLAVLLIYRSVVGLHEEEQLFLDGAEEHIAREQQEAAQKVKKSGPYVFALGTTSAVLMLLILGIWLWEGIASPH